MNIECKLSFCIGLLIMHACHCICELSLILHVGCMFHCMTLYVLVDVEWFELLCNLVDLQV